jgi:hypothetical protein
MANAFIDARHWPDPQRVEDKRLEELSNGGEGTQQQTLRIWHGILALCSLWVLTSKVTTQNQFQLLFF